MLLRYIFETKHNAWGWIYLGKYKGHHYWKLPDGRIGKEYAS